jgi:peptidoglycan/LPS O-acetylase OafA/YrhL
VRGLAISLILVCHLFSANTVTSSRLLAVASGIRESLWVGVDLFFALSGFLITGILFDALHSRHFLRNFYGRRCVRIFPLYYLALATLAAMSVPLAMHWDGFQWVLLTYLQNTPLMIGHSVPRPLSDLTGHLWSLGLEEQFYLFWPMIVLLVRDRRRLMTTALLLSSVSLLLRIGLMAHGGGVEYTYKMLPCRMDGLLIGGWLALAVRGPQREPFIRRGTGVFLGAMALILGYSLYARGFDWETDRIINAVGYTVTAIASTGLIAMTLAPLGRAARFFSSSVLRLLGRYSYGIYVWHMILGRMVTTPVRNLAAHFVHGKLSLLLAGGFAATVVSILLGILSYHLFEVHFLRLKRYFAYGRT